MTKQCSTLLNKCSVLFTEIFSTFDRGLTFNQEKNSNAVTFTDRSASSLDHIGQTSYFHINTDFNFQLIVDFGGLLPYNNLRLTSLQETKIYEERENRYRYILI